MGRHATGGNLLAFSVATKPDVLQRETGTLGQVPTLGCQPGGLRMHVWFKRINGLPAAGSKQSLEIHVDHSHSEDNQLVSNCNYLFLFS